MRKNFKFLVLTLSFVLGLSALVFGQQTAGTIEGTVKDPQGAVVPGASVTVEGVNVGFTRTVQTDNNGFYRIQQAPPGTYKVSVAAISGFAATTLQNPVVVVIEKVTTADVNLGVAGTAVAVDVTSDPTGVVVDPTDNKIQTNITTQLIDSLPKGTSFASVLRAAPATRPEPLSGGFQVDGASGSENTFLVDGQEVTNFRTGTLNAVNNIPTSLVQEVQVKSSGFEAEHGGASGGVVVVGTKSGTDQWRGEFGMQFEPSKLQATQNTSNPQVYRPSSTSQLIYAVQQPKDSFNNVFPTATFGGPIIKRKAWFIGSWTPQYYRTDRTVTYYRSFTAANGTRLIPNTTYAPEVYSAKTTYNYGFARVDAAPTNNLRVFASFLWNPAVYEGLLPLSPIAIGSVPAQSIIGGKTYTGANLSAIQGGRTNSNNVSTQAVWTPTQKAVVSFRYGRSFLNEKGASAYGIPPEERFRCLGVSGPYSAYNTGCQLNFQNIPSNNLSVKDISIRNTFNADLTYSIGNFGGSHILKGGYEYGKVKNDVQNGYRNYGYTLLYYGYDFSDLGVPGSCGTGCIGVGETIRFGTQGTASNRYNALYIQDKWQPFRRLTLNLGVRAENENLPSFNTGGAGSNQGIPIKFGWGDKIAPRIGGAYDVRGDGKSRIFASYGLFYDRLKFELPRGSFGGDFYRIDFYPILEAHPEYTYYTLPRILGNFTDPIGGGNPSTAGGLSIFQLDYRIPSNLNPSVYQGLGLPLGGVDPNLKPFTQSEFTVGYETELFKNYVFSTRFTRKNVENAIEDQANLGFYEAESYIIGNPGKGLAYDQRKAAGYVKQATAQREYKALEFVLNRRLANNYYFNVNYTFSRLYGNYSGLASSDENGRTSPGVNRFFDYDVNGFTALGTPDNGRLATDRPHVFKAYGGYNFDWWKSKTNTTELTFFQTIESGTPQTTFIGIASTSIPLSKRGDLGRTPTFSQTDLGLQHRYKFGRDNRFTLVGEINVLNLFNQSIVTGFNTTRYLRQNTLGGEDLDPCYNPYYLDDGYIPPGCTAANLTLTQALNNVLNGKIGSQLQALESLNGNKSLIYGKPSAYQGSRNIRFGFRLIF